MRQLSLLLTSLVLIIYVGVVHSQEKAPVPDWWQSKVDEVHQFINNDVKNGTVELLAVSPGGRKIHMISYGAPKPALRGTANYNSALGGRDPDAFYRKGERKRPVMIILAGVHGSEPEGIVNAVSVLNVMETGKDLMGREQYLLREHRKRFTTGKNFTLCLEAYPEWTNPSASVKGRMVNGLIVLNIVSENRHYLMVHNPGGKKERYTANLKVPGKLFRDISGEPGHNSVTEIDEMLEPEDFIVIKY